ncbi:hypothetical protein LLG96_13965 [bacterium]|nr:hypothetical protein [bacterium]
MKRLVLVSMVLALSVYMWSCGAKPGVEERVVVLEKYPDAYVGIGYSAKNLDENIAIEQAKANALIDISQQIETEVKSLSETYMRGTTASSKDAQVALSEQDFMRVAKIVTQNFLRGATPKEIGYRKDGSVRATIIMPKEEFYKDMKTKIPDQVRREALKVQIQHEEAQKKLDAEIDKRIQELNK